MVILSRKTIILFLFLDRIRSSITFQLSHVDLVLGIAMLRDITRSWEESRYVMANQRVFDLFRQNQCQWSPQSITERRRGVQRRWFELIRQEHLKRKLVAAGTRSILILIVKDLSDFCQVLEIAAGEGQCTESNSETLAFLQGSTFLNVSIWTPVVWTRMDKECRHG